MSNLFEITPQNKVKRAKILLYANGEGMSNQWIAKELNVALSDVTKWTKRWIDRTAEPVEERIADICEVYHKSREKFLMDKSHSLVFHYTPKHCSWMNQIEIWFGILMKKVITRGSLVQKVI